MKRVLFAVTGTVLGLVALLSFKTKTHPIATSGVLPQAAASTSHAPAGTTTSGSAPPRHRRSGPAAASSSPAASATRTLVGQQVQTYYGIVQVEVKVTGSHIDSVRFLKLTAFDQQSQQINAYAAQILLNETLNAQSAHIDTVSGATYTSEGYIQSLQSALDQAGI
jgi:uncharacterized protein with FMN-binding domain